MDIVHALSREEAIAIQYAAFRTDQPKITINLFLIQGETRAPILVDSGTGFIGGETSGRLRSALDQVGVASGNLATILLTHLHQDHSAGLTDGKGNAIFLNAEIVMERAEHAFWTEDSNFKDSPDNFKRYVSLIQTSMVS